MKNIKPKNMLGRNHVKILIADKLLDFQRLAASVHRTESARHNFRKIEISVTEPKQFQKNVDELQAFFEWVTDKEIKFTFSRMTKANRQQKLSENSFDYASLFSGGLDSSSYPLLQDNLNKRGLLSHTITSPRMQGVARKVHKKCIPYNHKVVETDLKLAGAANIPLLHMRGVVFLTNLMCVASEYDVKQIVIPENGPFMINYPVSMRVAPTRTTDPSMIVEWAKIFQKISGQKIKIETPFFNYTKSEIILLANKPELVKHTWSCSTSQGIKKMCGLCMACFVRILSLYAIKQGEELGIIYNDDVMTLSESKLKSRKKDSFSTLINCVEFWKYLIHPDLAPTLSERECCASIIRRHEVMKNHAADMYIGLENYLEINGGQSTLLHFVKDNLETIDDNVLEKRRSQLEKQASNYGTT